MMRPLLNFPITYIKMYNKFELDALKNKDRYSEYHQFRKNKFEWSCFLFIPSY